MVTIRKSTTYVKNINQDHVVIDGVSETIPNMVPDLRTLIRRNHNGQMVPLMSGGYTNEDYPELDRMDKVELAQFRMDLADEMQEMKQKLHASAKELEARQNGEKKEEDI